MDLNEKRFNIIQYVTSFAAIGGIFEVTGGGRWFAFSDEGMDCWVFNRSGLEGRTAVFEDWNGVKFEDCDFTGCVMHNFEHTGSKYIRCKLDWMTAPNKMTAGVDFVDCKWNMYG